VCCVVSCYVLLSYVTLRYVTSNYALTAHLMSYPDHFYNPSFDHITLSTPIHTYPHISILIITGEKLMKAVFNLARILQPSVIFFDEIDALMSARKVRTIKYFVVES
jgi:ATPase family associated with various cellular activities (AAA)